MGKYDNLIKSLRETTSVSKRKMLDGAAEAIEHLEKQVAHKEEIRLAQAKTIMELREKDIVANKRIQDLEEAMLRLLEQYSVGTGCFEHKFLSAEENAFDVLGIKHGDAFDEVWGRYREKWQEEGIS